MADPTSSNPLSSNPLPSNPVSSGPVPLLGTRRPPQAFAALLALAAVAAAALLRPHLPGGHSYPASLPDLIARGIVPGWLVPAAVVLGALPALAVLLRVGPVPGIRLVPAAGWAGAGLLLWTSSGIVLDAFRAFFALSGIPAGDFAVVDWPGAATRALALAAIGPVVAATVRHRRELDGACVRCGREDGRRPVAPTWPGYLAAGLMIPYPLLKAWWWISGSPEAPVGELVALVGGAVLALALVRPWGRRLPRRALIAVGWLVTGVLLSQGGLPIVATIADLVAGREVSVPWNSVVSVVYVGWALSGALLGVATRCFQRRTVPECPRCAA